MKKFNKVMSASIIGLACAGVMGNAQAGALATSVLTMSNFLLNYANGLAVDPTSITSNSNGTTVSAQLNNSAGVTNAPNVNSTNYTVTAEQGSTPANITTFPLISATPTAPTTTFAAGVASASGNPLVSPGAVVQNASYISLAGQGSGNVSNATNALNVTFTVTAAGDLQFSFDTSLYRENFLSAGASAGSQARTASSFTFNILDNTNTPVFQWSPAGAAVGGTSTATVNVPLTQTSHISSSGVSYAYYINSSNQFVNGTAGSPILGSFTADVALNPGTYTLTGTMTTNASASYIPEPGALALMGIGLLGLVVGQRRKSKFN